VHSGAMEVKYLCDLMTWPWPRKLLTLPFALRVSMCIVSISLCFTVYLLMPGTHNGLILMVPMGLSSWLFMKRGACGFFFGYIAVEIATSALFPQFIRWTPTTIYTFLGSTLALFIEGSTLVSLRQMLDREEVEHLKAEQSREQIYLAYEQQRQLNQLKNQFILNVNHELRTPLAAAYGYLELLAYLLEERGTLDKREHAAYLRHALNYCEELKLLVNNVLDTMAVGNYNGQLIIEDLQVSALVRDTLTHFKKEQQQAYTISVTIPDHLRVLGNAQCLRHVLYNLLSNAFKYSPKGSLVSVGAIETDGPPGQVCIQIRDQGMGIPPDEMPLLFGQFVRLQRDLAGTIRGTGLGLYISKQLIDAMGGKIWVESAGIPGQGSCFCFTLPNARLQLHALKKPPPTLPKRAQSPPLESN
jgi:signal transduction histidine kinase